MNRKDRRKLVKGDLDVRIERINQAERNLNDKIRHFDSIVTLKGKEFASVTIQTQLIPLMREVLVSSFDFNEDACIIYEEAFKEKFEGRMKEIHKISDLDQSVTVGPSENTELS